MGIRATARTGWLRATDWQANIGVADRLVRACVALSLLLLAGFTLAMASRIGAAGLTFTIAALYCLLTAAAGSDPLYARLGIDTNAPRGDSFPADPDADESPLHMSAVGDRSA